MLHKTLDSDCHLSVSLVHIAIFTATYHKNLRACFSPFCFFYYGSSSLDIGSNEAFSECNVLLGIANIRRDVGKNPLMDVQFKTVGALDNMLSAV
jgi:hypothetical protein